MVSNGCLFLAQDFGSIWSEIFRAFEELLPQPCSSYGLVCSSHLPLLRISWRPTPFPASTCQAAARQACRSQNLWAAGFAGLRPKVCASAALQTPQVLTPTRYAWQAAAWLGDSFEHNVHKPSNSFGPVSRNFWGRGVATFNRLQASESAELLNFAGHSLPSADQDSPSMTVEWALFPHFKGDQVCIGERVVCKSQQFKSEAWGAMEAIESGNTPVPEVSGDRFKKIREFVNMVLEGATKKITSVQPSFVYLAVSEPEFSGTWRSWSAVWPFSAMAIGLLAQFGPSYAWWDPWDHMPVLQSAVLTRPQGLKLQGPWQDKGPWL